MTAVSRRIVLIAGGASLTLGIAGIARYRSSAPWHHAGEDRISSWIAISTDGVVTLRLVSTDIGQGAQSGLAQIVADELDADWSQMRVEMAPVTDAYMVKEGGYYTGGSSSIRPHFEMFRKAGAVARAMLITAAATRWSVAAASCTTEKGRVLHAPSGRSLSYGELASAASSLTPPVDAALKRRTQWNLIGKPVPRFDIPDKVCGRAVYGIDTKLPNMLVATLAQCPFFGGRLASVDGNPALAVKGVRWVVTLDNAVAVVATNFWSAKKGLEALSPRWSRAKDPVASDDAMFAALARGIGAGDSSVSVARGQDKESTVKRVAAALAATRKTFEAEYRVPLLAHAPMEPMNATAHVTATTCELWAPMQDQGGMRDDLAKALGRPKSEIVLHTAKAGGGFGRRLQSDYGVLAALVAKAVGTPVKLIWTREEDFSHDFYRPASVAHLKAALDADSKIEALDYTGATSNDQATGGMMGSYAIADAVVRQKQVTLEFPIGSWRSVDPSITVFFLESFIDEIAHDAKIDPLAYRRAMLASDARGLRVLNAAAEMADWGRAKPGRFQGIAYFGYKYWGTAVAEIVELSVDANKRITLHKVYCAIDPGIAVNPDSVAAQAQGGIVMGLSAALGEAITLKDGQVEQKNFDSYSILRLARAPAIDVRVLDWPDTPPGGAGEPPVPPSVPALANALFAATGKRIRTLPLAKSGFEV